MSKIQFNKLQNMINGYPTLDLDHPKMYSNDHEFICIFSTYNRTNRMNEQFKEYGFISIPPVYSDDCNSWLFRTSKVSYDIAPIYLNRYRKEK